MKDKYFLKREKVANLLFDLVKYLLTTLGALIVISDKPISLKLITIVSIIATVIFILAVLITPNKED